MSEADSSRDVIAGQDITARDIVTGIQQNFTLIFQVPFAPPPDLETLRSDYLAYLRQRYRHLDIKGILQVQRVVPSIPLTAVYVPLKARPQRPDAGETWARIAGRPWHCDALPEEVLADMPSPGHQAGPVAVEVALKSEPAVVVLGDPGAGKTTLLKIIALALAQKPDGPLPILLPLNAYARRLQQQGAISLCQFLGEYYASRQDKLTQVSALFQAALEDKQAVILLDGLDEVQTDRSFLVGLVQDFVGECVPGPAEGDATVAGNRVVVTSRVVGYDEAPLGGQGWRVYTLTDFDRADIERFVAQWTLAYEIGVRGEDNTVARQAAEDEREELIDAIFARPSVERLAANPLLLTILALIKRTGVTLPEQRARLYELYLEALIESWNLARGLDQRPAGEPLDYLETVQVLAPLALWLRQTNPTAGLVTRDQLEGWLSDYYQHEWALSRGKARRQGRQFLDDVRHNSNLLVERGEGQYGFLHLTLEEMLAAKGIAQLADEGIEEAANLMRRYQTEPGWRETLLLAVGAIGVVQQREKAAGKLLLALLEGQPEHAPRGANVVLAGEALLDAGEAGVSRAAAAVVTSKSLVETMRDPACHIRERRDAGSLLGRLGWRPELEEGDWILPVSERTSPSIGLDAFRRVGESWMGKFPVTNQQYARFVEAGGYEERRWWAEEGWAWPTGRYDSKAPEGLQEYMQGRPLDKRDRPFWWRDRRWNSPLQPVVGITWFEALAYCAWVTEQLEAVAEGLCVWQDGKLVPAEEDLGRLVARLPHEAEWEGAMAGRGDYPWGDVFDASRLNCADSWAGRDLSDGDDWTTWIESDERAEASTTAVTTFPRGRSPAGIWDGSGNVFEWMADPFSAGGETIALRGGSWIVNRGGARVSSRGYSHPGYFYDFIGFRLVVAPVF